ncbi:hypothetical protein MBLNU230_g6351t1 [Neophaeotheca triangularis]
MVQPNNDVESFHEHLKKSKRVLSLCGAGLSAASGLPTFRGPGGLWRTHEATSLATPEAFKSDPGLVWQFYSYRRHKALEAHPNAAHYALAALSRAMPAFQTLSQNVDGLSQRADHPRSQLQLLHGTLFNVKCSQRKCDYVVEDFNDPIVPALAIPTEASADPTSNSALELDISSPGVELPKIAANALPKCPKCETGMLRPGVVWFGESLPLQVLQNVDDFLNNSEPIDLILVIGTSAKVYPAAGYIEEARDRGAKVCVVNMDAGDKPPGGWTEGDWLFQGDAAAVVPKLLKPIIGDVGGSADA